MLMQLETTNRNTGDFESLLIEPKNKDNNKSDQYPTLYILDRNVVSIILSYLNNSSREEDSEKILYLQNIVDKNYNSISLLHNYQELISYKEKLKYFNYQEEYEKIKKFFKNARVPYEESHINKWETIYLNKINNYEAERANYENTKKFFINFEEYVTDSNLIAEKKSIDIIKEILTYSETYQICYLFSLSFILSIFGKEKYNVIKKSSCKDKFEEKLSNSLGDLYFLYYALLAKIALIDYCNNYKEQKFNQIKVVSFDNNLINLCNLLCRSNELNELIKFPEHDCFTKRISDNDYLTFQQLFMEHKKKINKDLLISVYRSLKELGLTK